MKKFKDLYEAIIASVEPEEKIKFFYLFLMMLVGALLEMAGLSLILGFIQLISNPEMVLKSKWMGVINHYYHPEKISSLYVVLSIILIFVFILKNLYFYFYYRFQHRFFSQKRFDIVSNFARFFIEKPYPFFFQKNSAEVITIINSAIRIIDKVWLPLMWIISELVILTVVFIFLVWANPFETIVIICFLGVVSFSIYNYVKKNVTKWSREAQEDLFLTHKWLNQGFHGIKEVKTFSRENFFLTSFQKYYRVANITMSKIHAINQMPRLMIETVVVCGMISMILISLLFSENSIKNLTPILTLFAVAALRVMPSLNRIFNAAIEFKQGTVFLEKVQEYQLSLKGMAKNSERKDQQIQKRGFSESVNFNLVAYRYPGTEKDVLNGITFSLKKGKSYAFVGSSGAGKSTLIDLLLGLLKPNSGSIKIDQIDLQEDIQGWQKNIGYVPQSIYLIDDSILKNVAFGVDENKIEESKVVSALKQAQLFDFIDRLPEKTQTQIGDRGIRLSGGQKQRLGIARALYSNPEVLIFDEATSSLDMETEKAITGSMNEISKDKTVIIIAHRLATVRGCDHIYFMSEGSIVGEGTFTELLEKNKRFFEFAMSGQS